MLLDCDLAAGKHCERLLRREVFRGRGRGGGAGGLCGVGMVGAGMVGVGYAIGSSRRVRGCWGVGAGAAKSGVATWRGVRGAAFGARIQKPAEMLAAMVCSSEDCC